MKIPKYRRRVGRDYAFVEHAGKRHPLPGKYGSQESRDAYAAIIRDIARDVPLPSPNGITVDELGMAYLDHAKAYYDAKEYSAFNAVVNPLQTVVGSMAVSLFGPIALGKVRDALVELGWCRQYVNRQTNRIRRIFKWGVSKELVPPSVLAALQSLEPLRPGRTKATERPPVTSVDLKWVDATLEYCSPVLASMIRLQRLTGMRSQSLVALRPMDVDQSKDVWVYRPPKHKATWRGQELAIFIGPKAQEVLKPYLHRALSSPCFSPRESSYRGARRNAQYRVDTYRQAVGYAVAKANRERMAQAEKENEQRLEPLPLPPEIPSWFPHQLRHLRATEIRPKYGLEGAQVYLGHTSADVTQIYAERDFDLARRIASETG